MITLYTLKPSGNSHKVRIALALLGLDFEERMLSGGAHKRPPLIELNPLGQVPVLVDDDIVVRDSQAILVYLAARYRPGEWDGHDAAERGRIAQWLSLSGNEIAHGLARLRLAALFGAPLDRPAAESAAGRALDLIERQLHGRDWLEGDRMTIADLACVPYVALAPQGNVDLSAYPRAVAWTERLAALPNYPTMPALQRTT